MSEFEENIRIPVTAEQKAAFDALPEDLKLRLNVKASSAEHLRELKALDERLKAFGERVSTVMCPW